MEEEREEIIEEDAASLQELAAAVSESLPEEPKEDMEASLKEANEKYLRLYAEFDNFRKKVAKDKEELVKYANENILYEILPSIDHLDIALKHALDDSSGNKGLVEGVENTLRELLRTLEKFGLKRIDALGRPFDPEFHHAMAQVESDDVEDQTVVEEFRKGYIFGNKVLRASLVAVSKKPAPSAGVNGCRSAENNEHNEKEEL